MLLEEQNIGMSVEEKRMWKEDMHKNSLRILISNALSATSVKPSIMFLDWKDTNFYKSLKIWSTATYLAWQKSPDDENTR